MNDRKKKLPTLIDEKRLLKLRDSEKQDKIHTERIGV